MPESAAMIRIDLGPLDVLLPAAEFSGILPFAGGEETLADSSGETRQLLALDPLFTSLFGISSQPTDAEEDRHSMALLLRSSEGPRFAAITSRPFEFGDIRIGEFHLPPPALRRSLGSRGILALRFAGGKRVQYLLSLSRTVQGGVR